jgi:hypothetical protein
MRGIVSRAARCPCRRGHVTGEALNGDSLAFMPSAGYRAGTAGNGGVLECRTGSFAPAIRAMTADGGRAAQAQLTVLKQMVKDL